ncbi:MAG: tRNA (adenosine(37)-N6)-threonylcarbamoyltransferase complex ATPase subunit type 1 TsaE [bacterium]
MSAEENQIITTTSTAETIASGESFARRWLTAGAVVLLRGELGVGKTQFTKGIARHFGLDENEIASPTYSLVNEYEVHTHGVEKLFHLDCYRFEKPEELLELGVEEYLLPRKDITIIEWPERIEAYLPSKRIEVRFEVLSPTQRIITIEVKH